MNDRQQRFIKLLEEIFEINKSDLDFGIYRILNIKRKEIEDFFRNRLPALIEKELAPFASAGNAEIRTRIAEIEQQLGGKEIIVSMPDSVPLVAEYRKLQSKLAYDFDMAALESDVYSALYSFFNRYYEEGDFISKRRYKEGVYAIPYEGEEVKLYWANQDQYYIKTSENFKDYTFMAEDITVHFRLVDATTEQNNNKESENEKRVFMIFVENQEEYPGISTFSYDPEAKELVVRFTYDIPTDKKKKYADENYKAIVSHIASQHPELVARLMKNTSANPKEQKPLIQKHLEAYVAKNTFDYFIHKDLKGFLSRELDFYIKNEILHIDDIDSEDVNHNAVFFAKIRAIKKVARILIDFLAQLENFQKRLWLKKKFVVETNWCITLDNIDEIFYPDIAANQAQTEDWVNLFAIDKIEADLHTPGFSRPLTVDFLKANKNLVLDTRHFSHTFRDKLIASIDNLDEKTNSVLINADNFHALNLLSTKYNRAVSCIYGDPPYNAKSSEILYKNSYKHSSWLSMMDCRIALLTKLKTPRGVIITAIDENEGFNLMKLLDMRFQNWVKSAVTVLHNPAGIQGDNFSYSHEYAIFLFENFKHVIGKKEREETASEPFRDWGPSGLRNPNGDTFYPILVSHDGTKILDFGEVCEPTFHPEYQNIIKENWVEVYPVGDDGIEKKWVFARNSVEEIVDELYPVINNGIIQIMRNKSKGSFKTVWDEKKFYANIYGSKLLNNILGSKKFDFPKSVFTVAECLFAVNEVQKSDALILDYFAGSGTTGQAVLNLNRLDGRNRKFILIEMGEYFSNVVKPRIEKAIYSTEWKNGHPTTRTTSVSQIVKYMCLESYEDALSNVALKANSSVLNFGDDYLINYMLDVESRDSLLSVDKFNEPFDFAMYITERNETKVRKIDVVETFNYLIGLSVESKSTIAIFNADPSANPSYEGAVELRKDANGQFMFQQLEGTLPDGRRALVIWRNITDDVLRSNAALDAYFQKYRINPRDREFDVIFVNGDNNIENLRLEDENWKVVMTEREFNTRMWEEA